MLKNNNKNMSLLRLIIFSGLCGFLIMFQAGCSLIQPPDSILEDKTLTYHPGKFVWHDLVTSDVATTKSFYGQLFNWTFEQRGRYTIVSLNDKRIGGILDIQPKTPERHAARWISSLSVPDVDQATSVVLANGGFIEGWNKFDSLYWSFITALTVGYGDLHPLKKSSKTLSVIVGLTGIMFTGIVVAVTVHTATLAFEKYVDLNIFLQAGKLFK